MATQTSETLPAKEDVVSELIAALRSGKYDEVKSILQGHGHNFLAQDIFNVTTTGPVSETGTLTPLIEACQYANDFINDTGRQEEALEIVRLLLDYGADPDAKAWTRSHNQEISLIPLHMAVKESNVALTRVLLEGKALVDQTDDDGRSALHICCTGLWRNYLNKPYLEILNILISYKADVNLQDRNAVLVASKSEAGELLQHHLNIWRRWTSVRPAEERKSSLDFVLRAWEKELKENFESFDTNSLVELIQITTENLPESVGFDKCVLLTLNRLVSLIMKLCRRNRRVEETSKTERMIAIELLLQLLDKEEDGEPFPLQHLITRQNFMFQNHGGMTKYIDQTTCDYELMKTLLESGIQVNAVERDGNTMLHIAVRSLMRCIKQIKMFINNRNTFGRLLNDNTLADERHTYRFSEEVVDQWIRTVELLLEKGVYPNAQNKRSKTARDLLGVVTHDDREGITVMDARLRISDILQEHELQNSMTLKYMAAVVIQKSGYSYQNILPKALVKFVDLHKPRGHRISDKAPTEQILVSNRTMLIHLSTSSRRFWWNWLFCQNI